MTVQWQQTRREAERMCWFVRIGRAAFGVRALRNGDQMRLWLRRLDKWGTLESRRDGWRTELPGDDFDANRPAILAWASGCVALDLPPEQAHP